MKVAFYLAILIKTFLLKAKDYVDERPEQYPLITINSWNEWDPLKHVIVGRADDCHIPPEEPALDAKVPEDSDMRGQWGRRPQDVAPSLARDSGR